MRAILIDPEKRSVTEIDMPEGNRSSVDEMNKLIGSDVFCCGHRFSNEDTIYCDDEGLLKEEQPAMFRIGLRGGIIPGKGLVMGSDEEGNSVDAKTQIEDLFGKLRWLVAVDPGGSTIIDSAARTPSETKEAV